MLHVATLVLFLCPTTLGLMPNFAAETSEAYYRLFIKSLELTA